MNRLYNIKELIYDNKFSIISFIILLSLILISNAFIYYRVIDNRGQSNNAEIKPNILDIKEEVNKYKIDIKGYVASPGVYEVEEGSRVIDAIKLSGGLLEDADTSVNNLSLKIEDEMVIIIYNKSEVERFKEVKELEEVKNNNCIIYNEEVKNDSCIDDNITTNDNDIDKKISINTANRELLMTLPGIGEAKADKIIEYRNKNKFLALEDIMNVSGIGQSVFEKIKNYITI